MLVCHLPVLCRECAGANGVYLPVLACYNSTETYETLLHSQELAHKGQSRRSGTRKSAGNSVRTWDSHVGHTDVTHLTLSGSGLPGRPIPACSALFRTVRCHQL